MLVKLLIFVRFLVDFVYGTMKFDTNDIPDRIKQKFNQYALDKMIGKGGSAVVWRAANPETGQHVAIKCTSKNAIFQLVCDPQRGYIPNEFFILSQVRHSNIIEFLEYTEDEIYYYLVTTTYENCVDLFEFVELNGRIEERRLAHIAKQILSAVSYLHQQGYVHRDIKEENVLIDDNDKVYLLDFGFAGRIPQKRRDWFTVAVGTRHCMSPEILARQPYNGVSQDVWSIGVLLFTLAFGTRPFPDSAIDKMEFGWKHLDFKTECGIDLSGYHEQLVELIQAMLCTDCDQRITINEALHHPWFSKFE
jgi:maternal embryonic leucine zipper kinase